MNKYIIITSIVLSLLLTSAASAFSDITKISNAFSCDLGTVTKCENLITGQTDISYVTGIGIISSGWNGKAINFGRTTSNATFPTMYVGNVSISLHYKMNSSIPASCDVATFLHRSAGSQYPGRMIYYEGGVMNYQDIGLGGGSQCQVTATPTANVWQHMFAFSNLTGCGIYIDGILSWQAAVMGPAIADAGNQSHLGVRGRDACTGIQLDDITIINNYQPILSDVLQLNITPIADIVTPTFSIAARDFYTLNAINTFNVSITRTLTYADFGISDLLAWYRFDEGSGTTVIDSTGKGNNGVVINLSNSVGTSFSYVQGKINTAFYTNGNATYVNTTNIINSTKSFSASAWFLIKKFNDSNGIIGDRAFGNNWNMVTVASANKMLLAFQSWNQSDAGSILDSQSTTNITLDTWHLGTVVHDATNRQKLIYYDGVLEGNITYLSNQYMRDSSGALSIGINNLVGSHVFNGSIDDVRIYNKSLSAEEVSRIFNNSAEYYINTSFHYTTNGTIKPSFETGQIINITYNAFSYNTHTISLWNITNSINANLSPLSYQQFTLLTPNTSSTITNNYTISWTNGSRSGLAVNYTIRIYLQNGSYLNTIASFNNNLSYNWDNKDYAIGTYVIKVTGIEIYSGTTYDSNSTLTINPVSDYLTIYAADNDTDINITNTKYIITDPAITQQATPFTYPIEYFLNISSYTHNKTIIVFTEDLDLEHQNETRTFLVTRNNTLLKTYLEANQLVLHFRLSNGSEYNTEALLQDTLNVYNYTNTSIVIKQTDLTEGYVSVKFGSITLGNFSQFYEYINDLTTHINENLTLVPTPDNFIYIKATAKGGEYIQNAKIRISAVDTYTSNPNKYQLIGQRIQRFNEPVMFYTKFNQALLAYVEAEGYAPQTAILAQDQARTADNPFNIELTQATASGNATYLYTQDTMYTMPATLKATVWHIGDDKVELTTSYRLNLSLPKYRLTREGYPYFYDKTLVQGTDYPDTDANITLLVYINDGLTINYTIPLMNQNRTMTGRELVTTGLSEKILVPILLIALIIISAIVGHLIKTPTSGITTYKIGIATLTMMFARTETWMLWLVFAIILLEIPLKMLRRVIAE